MSLQTDFLSAINQVAAERNLDPQDIIEAIKEAIATGFRKNYPEYEESLINVEVGADTGEVTVFMDKKVVEKVSSKATQISLKEAQKLEEEKRKKSARY